MVPLVNAVPVEPVSPGESVELALLLPQPASAATTTAAAARAVTEEPKRDRDENIRLFCQDRGLLHKFC